MLHGYLLDPKNSATAQDMPNQGGSQGNGGLVWFKTPVPLTYSDSMSQGESK